MKQRIRVTLLGALLLPFAFALAQQATEIFIPIGESPGVSDGESILGTIQRVDYESRSMDVRGRDGTLTVQMDDRTRYYIDLTRAGQRNRYGSLADCDLGHYVEIRLRDDGKVDWIKIRPD